MREGSDSRKGSHVTPCETVTLDEFVFDSGEVIDDLDGRGFRGLVEPEAGWRGLRVNGR